MVLGEDGEPLDPGLLPNRRALASGRPEQGIVGYRLLPDGDERWSLFRSTPILSRVRERRPRDQRHPRRDGRAERARAGTAPRRDGSRLRRIARHRRDLRRACRPARAAPRRLLHRRHGRGRPAAPGRDCASQPGARAAAAGAPRAVYPPTANAAHPVSEVLATGEPYLVEDARVEALSHAAVDEEHLSLYRRLEALSYIVVPLEARGRMLGTISLGTGESGRRFGELDLSLARELARRAALAIDNALLFGAAQQSYAQLNTLLVSAPVGIGFWDRDLRFVRVNDALATINGLSPEEHVGRYLGDVVGELAPILVPLYRRVLETGEPVVHTESTDDEALQMGAAPPLALELLPGAHARGRGDRDRRGDHGDHGPEAGGRPSPPAGGGRRALLDLARPGRDRVPDRACRRAAAGGHVQRLPPPRRRARAGGVCRRRSGGAAGARVASADLRARRRSRDRSRTCSRTPSRCC